MAKFKIEKYARRVTIPVGSDKDLGSIDLSETITITITGKVNSLRAEVKGNKKEHMRASPAELTLNVTEVQVEGQNKNTFIDELNDDLDNMESGS